MGNPETRHGIVLAKSIPAKQYNIQTGETLYSALKKCPFLYIVPPSYDKYIRCSNAMNEILRDYSPNIQRFSVDEVFLDYTSMEMHFGEPITAAFKIKERIKNELGFTVSIGISSNKLLAKMGLTLKNLMQLRRFTLKKYLKKCGVYQLKIYSWSVELLHQNYINLVFSQ